ncbi:hypothetical protein BX600DRAFT_507775 [Xylariales sp. PMI_506]|nr:hypothetical protein BX600DRAFT_507775 [Xylariales sp. PMI_506]
MAPHQDEDDGHLNDKFFFPQGVSAILREQQPWLEVATERDEQGIPGLQPVPNEQKYTSVCPKGLNGDHCMPIRQAHLENSLPPPIQRVDVGQSQWPLQPVPNVMQGPPIAQSDYSQLEPAPQHVDLDPSHWTQIHQYSSQFSTDMPYQQIQDPYSYGAAGDQWQGHSSQWTLPIVVQDQAASSTIGGSDLFPIKNEGHSPPGFWKNLCVGRKWWVVGGAVAAAILVIVGATIGGVLGNKHTSSDGLPSSMSSTPTAPDNNNTDVAPLTEIRTNSRLAVTGWRGATGNYTLRFFFQDPDNNIRFMDKMSIDSNWTDPVTLDTLDYKPQPNSSISAGYYPGVNPAQIELFYIDTNQIIRGQYFSTSVPQKGTPSSINRYPLEVSSGSTISCYFPNLITQDDDSHLRWLRMLGASSTNTSQPWWINDTSQSLTGSMGTGLAMLPLAQHYESSVGLIYRAAANGSLATATRIYNITGGTAYDDGLWDGTSAPKLAVDVPAASAIGALSVGRQYTTLDLNTYILYQDESASLQVVWQDGGNGSSGSNNTWQGPETYDALNDAEPGTDIACVTQGAWGIPEILVSSEQDMNRCFFQERDTRRVKEVWYNGTDWNFVGYVPLS